MASSLEAFSRLRTWKKRSTVLNLTVVTNSGIPVKHVGEVFSVDEKGDCVGFIERATRNPLRLNLAGAAFRLGAKSLEASRGEDNFVAFEER